MTSSAPPRRLRVLMTLQPAWSHVNTMTPLAKALESLGHDVLVATASSMCPEVEARGLTATAAGMDWDAARSEEYFPGFLKARGTSQARLLASLAGRGMVDDLQRICDTFNPDLIVRDASEFGGALLGALRPIPVCVVGIGLRAPLLWLEGTLRSTITALRQRYGLPSKPERTDFVGQLWLSSFPSSFALAEPEGINEFLIRPIVEDGSPGAALPSWFDELGEDAVYLTLGTVFNHNAALLTRVAKTLAAMGLDVVVTTGSTADPADLGPLPARVHVARYVSQRALMPRVRAVVCHGGFNTVMTALAAGRPVSCIPLSTDHPANASRCAALGVGTTMATFVPHAGFPTANPADLTVEQIESAVQPILREPGYQERAQALGGEILSMPGPDAAAKEMVGLVRAG